ncbi:MAG: helix-turn-helix transcriptional regulator [Muribaculaceae bacterium]|nr:helix-turn-helix transcriptional regulator [Muribaculaceae bacterium]
MAFKSKANIINNKIVEVTVPDGEKFQVFCRIGCYISEDTKKMELKRLESIFDDYYSEDKEQMINNIWINSKINGISFLGISPGDRQQERTRIGSKIKEIRVKRDMEARDLAKLAGIDAANLSRIENGKYSVGFDVLSKIAASLGKKLDLVDIDK